MFIDRVQFDVRAGRGGDGIVAFRREKYVPKGGPDGGDGGRGGSVRLVVDAQLGTLLDLRYKKVIKAENGQPGMGKKRFGRNGKDAVVRVPPGTVVFDVESGELLGDLTSDGDEMVIARGGRGGKGNPHFATPTLRTPRKATPGRSGEQRSIRLELKLLADVGLVGLPNAGKSTLLSVISAARPEIANYPFTTLTPHLGIVRAGDYESFVVADIPGLIEGASDGKGLGHQFLRHVERTRVLSILIDALDEDPAATEAVLLGELERYNPALLTRPRLVVRTKADLGGDPWDGEDLRISSAAGIRVDELIHRLFAMVREAPEPERDWRLDPSESESSDSGDEDAVGVDGEEGGVSWQWTFEGDDLLDEDDE